MNYIVIGSDSPEYIELSARFIFHQDDLYPEAWNTRLLDGYYDIICHSDGWQLFCFDLYGQEIKLELDVVVDALYQHSNYSGENIRLVACYAGAFEYGVAQQLADLTQKEVLAPRMAVFLFENGDVLVTPDQTSLEDPIYTNDFAQERAWDLFKPRL